MVIDNGGGACKLGLASQPASVRRAPPHASHACSTLLVMSVQALPRASAHAATGILIAPTRTPSSCMSAGRGRVFPNCTARPGGGKQLVGPQLLEAANVSGLTVRRPIERGYLTNPDLQVRPAAIDCPLPMLAERMTGMLRQNMCHCRPTSHHRAE